MCLIFFGHIKSVNYSLLPILSSYSQLGWTQVIPPPKKKKKKKSIFVKTKRGMSYGGKNVLKNRWKSYGGCSKDIIFL
jgi:hypothetical protein